MGLGKEAGGIQISTAVLDLSNNSSFSFLIYQTVSPSYSHWINKNTKRHEAFKHCHLRSLLSVVVAHGSRHSLWVHYKCWDTSLMLWR